MDKKVCCFFKEERKRLNYSQKDIADFLGMSVKQVGRWESSVAISADKLALLADLGFDVQYVVTGNYSGQSSFNPAIHKRAIDILAKFIAASGRNIKHPDKFYAVSMEIYKVIERAEKEEQEIDQAVIGGKVISLFAA
jgi:transcriptional regulator with XRE-family HTH domain